MIGNKFLKVLYEYPDRDTGLNQLLELLKTQDSKFINSLNEPINLDLCNGDEIQYLTVAVALIDYYLQINNLEVPQWLRNERLCYDKPYYYSKRLTDFEKFKLLYTNPAPLKNRNVYFDLQGIYRV